MWVAFVRRVVEGFIYKRYEVRGGSDLYHFVKIQSFVFCLDCGDVVSESLRSL